ncbi:MAG: biotin synthase BioB, partial [Lentisphaerae bacterium]|nr:biotin synthase BioB [Lentisphaerota bacterium]
MTYQTSPEKWREFSKRICRGETLTRAEALAVLTSHDDDLLHVLAAAFEVRLHFCGRDVSLHVLHNAKSGQCPEDCSYCSQSHAASTDVPRYPLQSVEEIVAGAHDAAAMQAIRYCTVISGRQPDKQAMATICAAARQIRKELPRLQICVSMGLLTDEQARLLKAAGVNRYNHNLETSPRFYPEICRTHNYTDRLDSAAAAKRAGLELCSGGLLGMGETLEDRVDLAMALRELEADSMPVNFLDPRPGTALADQPRMRAMDALKTMAMFRFVLPDKEIRIAGGREA